MARDTSGGSGSSMNPPGSNSEKTPLTLKKPTDAVAVAESFAVRSPASETSPQDSHMGEQALDYIGTAQAIKNLFSLPYAPDESVSVGIHNIEGCLLIDADPSLTRNEPTSSHTLMGGFQDSASGVSSNTETPGNSYRAADSIVALPPLSPVTANNVQQSAALSAINSMLLEERTKQGSERTESSQLSLREKHSSILPHENSRHDIPASAATEPRDYVHWEFHDIKVLVGSDAYVYRSSPEASLAVRIEDATEMRQQLTTHENMKRKSFFTPGHDGMKRTYADALRTRQLEAEEEYDEKQDDEHQDTIPSSSSFPDPDLEQVQLQTCIVPSMTNLTLGGIYTTTNAEPPPSTCSSSSPVCTVIDAYLDNIIANVPQLALCLREKGFVQSVKLLSTEELPSAFMQERTFDTSTPFEVITGNNADTNVPANSNGEPIFSPAIMDMNAATLLRFLKANCTKDNATYLLHREAGQTNIQLYDVSSISNQRQRKWLWWLATMSYRFALRLRHLSMHMANEVAAGRREDYANNNEMLALQRTFRSRSRSLLQNTHSLLEEFADMDGPMHENFRAEVCEKIAESFLQNDDVNGTRFHKESEGQAPNIPTPATSSDPSQRLYSNVPADSLVKAQDYLSRGIKTLWKAQTATNQEIHDIAEGKAKKSRRGRRQQQYTSKNDSSTAEQHSVKVISIHGDSSSSEDDEDNEVSGDLERSLQLKSEAMAAQLYSLHDTLINVSLRLAEYHLNGYWSSSLMQALRSTARRMADAISLFEPLSRSSEEIVENHLILSRWRHALQLQYTRLWELSGHFARSFAADDLWRDRGHAAGDDVISVLRDVEAAFPYSSPVPSTETSQRSGSTRHVSVANSLFLSGFDWFAPVVIDVVETETLGFDGDLTGIVCPERKENNLSGIMNEADLNAARSLLEAKKQLQRDRRRVLVAAALSYKRAIVVYEGCRIVQTTGIEDENEALLEGYESTTASSFCALLNLLRQRLGDSCNEIGKVLLNELRAVLAATQSEDAGDDGENRPERAAEPLLSSAEFWFSIGIHAFEGCGDLRNAALLRANVCQCYKLRANAMFANSTKIKPKTHSSSTEKVSHAELCLQEAANHLQAAHESLGERDVDPATWDMVSNELAATYLVLGVRRRQSLLGGGSAPLILHAVRLSPGQERSILSPMEKSLKIYEQSGNLHQAAAVQYQLALFFSKVWTCQRDEAKTREKLSAAFEHFKVAHSYFFHSIRGNEPTFVLLSLDICNLYATVSGEECLKQALLRCLDTLDAFSRESIDLNASPQHKLQVREEWLEKMKTLASSVEDRLFKTIRGLVKLEETANSDNSQGSDGKYKELYRAALSSKMTAPNALTGADEDLDNNSKSLLCLHKVLEAVQETYSSISS